MKTTKDFLHSCDFPGVLEKKECLTGTPLGLYGIPGPIHKQTQIPVSTFHSTFQTVWFIIQDEEERPRPEFAAKAPYLEKNPITGVREPAFPKAVRCLSLTTNGCFLSLVAQHCFPIEFKHTTKQFLPASFLYISNAYSSSWSQY